MLAFKRIARVSSRCRRFGSAAADWGAELAAFRKRRTVQKEMEMMTGQSISSSTSTKEDDAEKSSQSLLEWRTKIEEETEKRQLELQMFAYPESRAVPFSTISLLCAAGILTTSITILRSRSKEENSKFTNLADRFSICGKDLQWPSLLTASLWRDDRLPVAIMHTTIFALAGSVIEKIHGPATFLLLAFGSTVLTNFSLYSALPKLPKGCDELPIIGTTGGLSFIVGITAFKYGNLAILPGVYIPCYWLLAPLLARVIHQASRAMSSARQLRLRNEQKENLSTETNVSETQNKNVIPDAKQFLTEVEKKVEKEYVDNSHLSLRQVYDILLANSLQSDATKNEVNVQGQFLVDENLEERQREMMEKQEHIENLEKEFAIRHPGDWSFLADVWALGAAYLICKVLK